jgi:hypothetical protein
VHLLVSLHLVGTWVFFAAGFFVSLGGCHHLDSLEQQRRSSTCWWLFMASSDELVVRGCCGSSMERRIPTLGNARVGPSHHLVGSCGTFWEARCVILISHRTTWCKGTQRGLACQQAREPRDKSYVLIVFDQLDFIPVIGYFIDYLGIHFGWLNHRHSV